MEEDTFAEERPSEAAFSAARTALGLATGAAILEPPEWLKKWVGVLAPHAIVAVRYLDCFVELALPFAVAVVVIVKDLVFSNDIAAGLFGALVCFYGGNFVKLIAVVEALKVTGVAETLHEALRVLSKHVQIVVSHDRKDSRRESFGVTKASGDYSAMLSRKLAVWARAVQDPAALSQTLSAIWSATATVLACVRVGLARTVVLGVALAGVVRPLALREAAPLVAAALRPEHRQWAPTIVDTALKTCSVALAWQLSRFVSAWHSACRGGALFAAAVLKEAKHRGYLPRRLSLASDTAPHRGSDATGPLLLHFYADELLGFVFAYYGVRTQLVHRFALPTLLKILLLPAILAESLLGVFLLGAA